jgi:dienelactone hydrolase
MLLMAEINDDRTAMLTRLLDALAMLKTGHAFTAENIPLDETKTFGFQPDTYRRSWKAMTDFLAEALS